MTEEGACCWLHPLHKIALPLQHLPEERRGQRNGKSGGGDKGKEKGMKEGGRKGC